MKTQTFGIDKWPYLFTLPYFPRDYPSDYRTHRENGEAQDSPPVELKYDGKAEWEKQPDGYYHVKYTEGSGDKLWMEAKDLNYLTRLVREGTLMQKEPTWREVLGNWEPESKRVTAIARVESEIKARAEVEVKEQKTKEPKPM